MSDFGMNLWVIDEKENNIELLPSEEIHRRGLLHRAMHVMVRNAAGEFYVRRRSPALELYPGVWTSSVGEHVFEHETYDDTARRATREFLGLQVPLELVGKVRVHDDIENELMAVYAAHAESIPHLSREHSEEGRFMPMTELQTLVDEGVTTPHLSAAVGLLLSGT